MLDEELLDFLKSLDGFLGSAGPQKFVGKKAPHEKPLLGIGWRKRSPAQFFRAAGVGPLERLEVDIIRNASEPLGHGLRTVRASFRGIVRIGLAGGKQQTNCDGENDGTRFRWDAILSVLPAWLESYFHGSPPTDANYRIQRHTRYTAKGFLIVAPSWTQDHVTRLEHGCQMITQCGFSTEVI